MQTTITTFVIIALLILVVIQSLKIHDLNNENKFIKDLNKTLSEGLDVFINKNKK